MTALDALQLLRDKGSLLPEKLPRHMIAPCDTNQPVANAIRDLLQRTRPNSKEQPWMPPSNAVQILP